MAETIIYNEGWTLDDVQWSRFDASKVEPSLLAAVKAASLVEYAAPDYVSYLKRVFAGADAKTMDSLEKWGREELQHGQALSRWAMLADPAFDFASAFARFKAGYKPPHFDSDDEVSVRGSRRGEMIARCVVESGTSSYYSAIRDATDEPVLKEITGRIAADEFRHYRLFYETLIAQDEPDLPFWKKIAVAIGRANESDDDELAYAYYAANVPAAREAEIPYDRKKFASAYNGAAMILYQPHHVRKLVQMVARACGANPQGRLTGAVGAVAWRVLHRRAARATLRAAA
ncbi:MAG TPA: ferritin-like domain-containing protein [Rhizomicrobium sp.]|nr:ferritin-like domain-containing protein [Rhizomicrobium sp.]